MKTKPLTVAALVCVAVFVSEGFAVLSQRVARIGEAWVVSARSSASHGIAPYLMKAGAGVWVQWAKS